MKLAEVGEFGLINRIKIPAYAPEQLILGIGDDCAVLPFNDTHYQLVSCDLLVEDVHFIRNKISAFELGYKAIAVNLSDVAAMGGKPVHVTLSMALPADYTVDDWTAFYDGVQTICRRYGVNVIGGDTTAGAKLTINVTVIGLVEQQYLHLRSHAKPGDVIFVTGDLGGSRAGLELILKDGLPVSSKDRVHLLQRHCKPEPCCHEIAVLNRLAGNALHALNDISDGILSESTEIATASHVAMVVNADSVPVNEACRTLADATGKNGLQWALTGGEDYQLVGTMDAEKAEEICEKYRRETGKDITIVGYVEAGEGAWLEQNGDRRVVMHKGYDHFGSSQE